VFRFRSLAASVGGIEDQGIGLSAEARALVLGKIADSGALLIDEKTFEGSLERRMALYDQAARGRPFAAYVNIGGGSVSVGRSRGKSFYKPGINRPGPAAPIDSIIGRFLERGVPVVNLTKLDTLARAHGLPVAPDKPQVVGQGEIFGHTEPNRPLAAVALLVLSGAIGFVKQRSLRRAQRAAPVAPPEG
jgi:poly-gamma-glutamate system protein